MDGIDLQDISMQRQQQYENWTAMYRAARQTRNACLYFGASVDDNNDAQYGAEWRINEADMLRDMCETQRVQLVDYETAKERLTLSRILLDDARREIATLRARIAELEQAVIFAEPAAPPDDVTRHLLNLKVSELAPLEALTKLMELKRMALESAPAPDTETPAAVRQHLRGQRKRVEAPPLVRKLAKMTDEEAEILFPDNQWEPADPDA